MLRLLSAGCLALCLAGPVAAQQTSVEVPPPVLTIDQDRLFAETRIGAEALAAFEADAEVLAAENAAIEEELIAQELALTEERSTLEPEAFKEKADAFDQRVRQLRSEQDEKARNLNQSRDAARQAFFNEVAGVISGIVRERGALMVLDRRDVFLSADSIDITEEAIRRVNRMEDTE